MPKCGTRRGGTEKANRINLSRGQISAPVEKLFPESQFFLGVMQYLRQCNDVLTGSFAMSQLTNRPGKGPSRCSQKQGPWETLQQRRDDNGE
jgi:hypothetical protein